MKLYRDKIHPMCESFLPQHALTTKTTNDIARTRSRFLFTDVAISERQTEERSTNEESRTMAPRSRKNPTRGAVLVPPPSTSPTRVRCQ